MEATTEKVKILSAGAITAMLRRMAFEVYERNFDTDRLVLGGIGPRGCFVADVLEKHLAEISPLKLTRCDFVKLEQGLGWQSPPQVDDISESAFLIVDDVLYSGSTIVHALAMLAPLTPARVRTAVLIDRGHHRFPVQANYVGMEIATSLKQYVSVEVNLETQRAEGYIY